MLGPSFKPKGILTKNVRQMNTNENTLFGNDVITVYFGWRIRQDKIWEQLSGVYMVEMATTKTAKWVTDLSSTSIRFGVTPAIIIPSTLGFGDGLDVSIIAGNEGRTGTI